MPLFAVFWLIFRKWAQKYDFAGINLLWAMDEKNRKIGKILTPEILPIKYVLDSSGFFFVKKHCSFLLLVELQ